MSKPTTGRYSVKPYRCSSCGQESDIGTNHWGECYSCCLHCGRYATHECLEPCPQTHGKEAT